MLGGIAAALQIGAILDEAQQDLAQLNAFVVEVGAFLEFGEAAVALRGLARWTNNVRLVDGQTV